MQRPLLPCLLLLSVTAGCGGNAETVAVGPPAPDEQDTGQSVIQSFEEFRPVFLADVRSRYAGGPQHFSHTDGFGTAVGYSYNISFDIQSFDVRRTDSLIRPYVGEITLAQTNEVISCDERARHLINEVGFDRSQLSDGDNRYEPKLFTVHFQFDDGTWKMVETWNEVHAFVFD